MDETILPYVNVEHSMSPSFHIPTEVCENIIDMLFSHDSTETLQDIATLHSCALVCGDWRVRSQRMLFYKVQLSDTTSFRRLSTILDDAHHLRDYVHQVELAGYHLHNTTSIFALFPAVFAGKLPNLFRIDIVHFSESEETPFPKILGAPKAKALPYIPLHPRFRAFLSAFTAMSTLYLVDTTFRTFSEFARMIHGLPRLKNLACQSVNWIAPGGSHPGADFTLMQPEWAAVGKDTLPPFAPKIQQLVLFNIAEYGARRLTRTRGPLLAWLSLAIPLSSELDQLASGGGINLGSCTGLHRLSLYLTPQFSMDAHGEFVSELLASWKSRNSHSTLKFVRVPDSKTTRTRQRFLEVLRGLGTVTEAQFWTPEEPPHSGEVQDCQRVNCLLEVEIHEWEAQRKWWMDHLGSCFPTWSKAGKLKLIICTPQNAHQDWADEEKPLQSDAAAPSQVEEAESSSLSKDAPSA